MREPLALPTRPRYIPRFPLPEVSALFRSAWSASTLSVLCALALVPLPVTEGAQKLDHSPGQILVRFRNGAAKLATDTDGELTTRFGIVRSEPILPARDGLAKPASPFGQVFRITYDAPVPPDLVASAFSARSDVLYAGPNHLFRPLAVPDDPRLPEQTNLDRINWQTLWDGIGPKLQDVTVAIIDSGVEVEHVDLKNRIWVNAAEKNGSPGVDDDRNGYVDDIRGWDFADAPTLPGRGDYLTPDNDPSDESGHGTQVAGVVGAEADNGKGITGVAPDCRLMALRAGVTMQSGETFLEEDDLAAAIVYAVDNGARVLNMSWGSDELAYVIRDALAYADARGAVLVVAAGNTGELGLSQPAALDVTIAVGATDNADRRSGFSSRGVPLDLVAPGSSVLSTSPGDIYSRRSGTSFSAPHISGLAALVLSRRPDLSPHQVRAVLTRSVADIGPLGWDDEFGAGRADGERLLTTLGDGQDVAVVRIETPQTGSGFDGPVLIEALVNGGSLISYQLSWGFGRSPDVWNVIQTGAASADINAVWQTVGLVDTIATLRLAGVLADGSLAEDRVLIAFGPAPPAIVSHSISQILDGDRLYQQVRWTTAAPSRGRVAFGPAGALLDTLTSPIVHTQHTVTLAGGLPSGSAEYSVIVEGPSGRTAAAAPSAFEVRHNRVPTGSYAEVAQLPDGFLADRVADFDGDGLPEIVLMPYVQGATFSPPQAFERSSDGSFESVFTWPGSYMPWSVGDVDGDGAPDLMGTEVARMRVFTRESGTTHPQHELFEFTDTWGGEIVDLEGDGTIQIIARGGSQNGFDILAPEQGEFSRVTFLSNPSSGPGGVSQRPVVADLDGDGRVEILSGDADGDLWTYEQLGGAGFTATWQSSGDDATDARWVGGGADLDGDGDVEFAVARAKTDDDDALNGYWEVEIYSALGPDSYALEWQIRITGVLTSGNGVTTADADGDGQPDLVLCLRPDIYVIRSDAADSYRPAWHGPVGLTHRPLVTDLDTDGLPEILFNREDAVRVLERTALPAPGPGPELLSARPLGPNAAALAWLAVDDAVHYRLLRASHGSDLTAVADSLTATSHIDTALTTNTRYQYQVVAVLADASERVSGVEHVRPNPNPRLTRLSPLGIGQIGVTFNEPVSSIVPDAIRLMPAAHRATSVIRDLEYRHLLLTFPQALDPEGSYSLDLSAVTDTSGVPIDLRFATVAFTPGRTIYPSADVADFDTDGDVDFSDFLLFVQAYGGDDPVYDLDTDGAVGFSDFILFASLYGLFV